MEIKNCTVGFAMTGSFCTVPKIMPSLKELVGLGINVIPIASETLANTDTRFGKACDLLKELKEITGNTVIKSMVEAEPIGPQKMLDILVIAPCTGNTMSKIANGITDTCVTMSAKAHLRNGRPVVIGVSTNDGLGLTSKNIAILHTARNIFFVPYGQDDPFNKGTSLICSADLIVSTVLHALEGIQIQPLLIT